jgi:GDP-L-fucose synthase
LASEKYNKSNPVNIGTGQEIAIQDLFSTICEMTNFKGRIILDSTKPDGQPRRCLDVTKAAREFGFRARTELKEGLQRTIEFYRNLHK